MTLVCLLIVLNLLVTGNAAKAQNQQNDDREVKVPKRGLPGRRENGGTRGPNGNCLTGDVALLALLLPKTNLGLTTSAYPRFFWYNPENTAKKGKFVLYKVDKQMRSLTPVYATTFKPNQKSGITSLNLPQDGKIPPLTANQNYLWSVSLICNPKDNSPRSVITVEGWVQRVQVNKYLAIKLQLLNQRDRLTIYAQEGLWFDLLSTLADLHTCHPEDTSISNRWTQILNQVDLQAIAQDKHLYPYFTPDRSKHRCLGESRN
ncbi:MAG: DUF928 domain-containing protein [Nostocaceae cyanobacterium]|nr:DUF928 domain-containing protein [Nostocaceae cyanobacterium]